MTTITERKNANQYTQVLDMQTTAQTMSDACEFINAMNLELCLNMFGCVIAEDQGYFKIKEASYVENGCKVLICYLNENDIVYKFAPTELQD